MLLSGLIYLLAGTMGAIGGLDYLNPYKKALLWIVSELYVVAKYALATTIGMAIYDRHLE